VPLPLSLSLPQLVPTAIYVTGIGSDYILELERQIVLRIIATIAVTAKPNKADSAGEALALQPIPKGLDCKVVRRRGSVNGRERRLRKVQTESCTVLNRVFYKEIEEGVYNIVNENIILLI
jgi:hypothetical protein